MIIEQIYLDCLAQASYLIIDEKSKKAAVIDPRRDVAVYLDAAKKHGVKIDKIVLTHFHADFVSGHLELQAATGADIYLGPGAAEFPHITAKDGDVIELGDTRLLVWETPGHTPESICVQAFAEKADKDPQAIFTGDTLFVGDVGRPDLLVGKGLSKEYLAEQLFDSLQRLLTLPDATIVYPGHGPGSACGKQLGSEKQSTIGQQRRFNYALKISSKPDFVRVVTGELCSPPAYFSHDAEINRKQRPLLSDVLKAIKTVTQDEVSQSASQGAQLLDVRPADEFAAGHLNDAIGVPLQGKFASWVGTFLRPDKPIFVLCNRGQEEEAITRLARIGFDVSGVFHYENAEKFRLRAYERVNADQLSKLVSQDKTLPIIDIRNPDEWEKGHIEGSKNIPLNTLQSRLSEFPTDGNFVLHCQSGYRSTIGAALLLNAGITGFRELRGGYLAWAALVPA